MITIYNRQRTYDIDTKHLRDDIQRILQYISYPDFAICVWITTNSTIRRYNRIFRGKDKATDVISFPFHPELKPGERIVPEDDESRILGDIIISAEYVARQSRTLHVPLYSQLRRLVVHGICHLLGYDHQTHAEYRQMWDIEQRILALFHQSLPHDEAAS